MNRPSFSYFTPSTCFLLRSNSTMSIASTLLLAIFTHTLGSHVSARILHFLSAYQCLPMLTNLHMLFPFVSFCFRLVWSAVLFRIPMSIKDPDFFRSF